MTQTAASRVLALVRQIPEYPIPGVSYQDITPVLADPGALAQAVTALAESARAASAGEGIDLVVGIEARGFILGGAVAVALGAGFAPVRKHGKLPAATVGTSYELEYGAAEIEMHADALQPGQRVLVVDDVLATGGTAAATCRLVERLGGAVVAIAVLLELPALNGRNRLGERSVVSVASI